MSSSSRLQHGTSRGSSSIRSPLVVAPSPRDQVHVGPPRPRALGLSSRSSHDTLRHLDSRRLRRTAKLLRWLLLLLLQEAQASSSSGRRRRPVVCLMAARRRTMAAVVCRAARPRWICASPPSPPRRRREGTGPTARACAGSTAGTMPGSATRACSRRPTGPGRPERRAPRRPVVSPSGTPPRCSSSQSRSRRRRTRPRSRRRGTPGGTRTTRRPAVVVCPHHTGDRLAVLTSP
mmetsp:Transcript_25332/g.100975  ORF Transcript_25332/g.100975 Transcript_25332/m.100975 type:complete len:234 (-) Transcript_25332:839-1540(-)